MLRRSFLALVSVLPLRPAIPVQCLEVTGTFFLFGIVAQTVSTESWIMPRGQRIDLLGKNHEWNTAQISFERVKGVFCKATVSLSQLRDHTQEVR